MSDRPPRGRVVAFCVLATVILVGPVYGHFFATGSAKYLGWKMFSRKATDFCAVEYWWPSPAGRQILDRFAELKQPAGKRSGHLWRIRDVNHARKVGEALCAPLATRARAAGSTERPDVRMAVRCARPTGWEVMQIPDVNLCAR